MKIGITPTHRSWCRRPKIVHFYGRLIIKVSIMITIIKQLAAIECLPLARYYSKYFIYISYLSLTAIL